MRAYSIDPRKKRFFGIERLSLTVQLIILNVFLYVVGLILLSVYGSEFLTNSIAIKPSLILEGKSLWTFLTSMFMHGGLFHVFANMFSLFFIGSFLEKIIGRKRFFWVYLIAGLVGGIFFVLSSMIFGGLENSAVGASGALFGLLGVLAVLVPFSRIYLIVGPLVLILVEVVASKLLPSSFYSLISLVFNVLIIIMIFGLFSNNQRLRKIAVPVELPMWLLPIIAIVPLVIIGFFVELPIGNSAHFGGLVVGLIYGFYLRKKFPRKIAKLSRHFS